MASSAKRKKRKASSCSSLRKKAKRIKNPRKRKQALKKLPKRCKTPAKPPTSGAAAKPDLPKPTNGTQPSVAPARVPPPVPAAGVPVAAPVEPPPAPARVPEPTYSGTFGPRQAERLMWRAGFGPLPGDGQRLAALGMQAAVTSLTRPSGTAVMTGAEPRVAGAALAPYAIYGHDHLWWLDRMARSSHQLVERMALVFHDWFATSNDGIGNSRLMLIQNNLFRQFGLGRFDDLLRAVTIDPAMLVWLSGRDNVRGAINENYGRELMELFTLGADRGAYTEADVREIARALSGWTVDWLGDTGWSPTARFDSRRFDNGTKTVFGKAGNWGWEDAVRLVLEHPLHASFFVTKLWSYFVPSPPSASTQARLEQLYTSSGRQIRPVVEAILTSSEFYGGDRMVKPPIVQAAGMMRQTGQGITDTSFVWQGRMAGQQLFLPPDVSGWDDSRWLDTSTMAGRWWLVNQCLAGRTIPNDGRYPAESPDLAMSRAHAFWGSPWLSEETWATVRAWAASVIEAGSPSWVVAQKTSQRQNALRQLLAMSPDFQTS